MERVLKAVLNYENEISEDQDTLNKSIIYSRVNGYIECAFDNELITKQQFKDLKDRIYVAYLN